MDGTEAVRTELILDLRRRRLRKARLMRFVVVTEPDVSVSLDELEESEEDDESSTSARIPGCDSSSMICCGVLSYK